VVFRAVVFKLLVWCVVEGYVSGMQDAMHPAYRTHTVGYRSNQQERASFLTSK